MQYESLSSFSLARIYRPYYIVKLYLNESNLKEKPMHHALENKVAIIVGSSSGMGKATARSYAQAGASVVLAARSKDKLDT